MADEWLQGKVIRYAYIIIALMYMYIEIAFIFNYFFLYFFFQYTIEMTASERLSLDEEYQAQQEWITDPQSKFTYMNYT